LAFFASSGTNLLVFLSMRCGMSPCFASFDTATARRLAFRRRPDAWRLASAMASCSLTGVAPARVVIVCMCLIAPLLGSYRATTCTCVTDSARPEAIPMPIMFAPRLPSVDVRPEEHVDDHIDAAVLDLDIV